jgi:phage gp45-like
MVKYATQSALSDRFGFGYVAPPQIDESDGDKSTQQRVRFMQWFGFRSTPVVKNGECIVVAPRGGPSNAVALAADNLSYGPLDLAEGETVVYDKSGSIIRLHSSGDITIIPKAGSRVKLGDGTDANLDQVVLSTELRAEVNAMIAVFNNHEHSSGTLLAPEHAGPVTGKTGRPDNTADDISTAIGSSNVVAKK